MEPFILWTKAVVFHLTLGYISPPFHSQLQGDYFTGRRVGGSSRDGPSVSGWSNSNSTRANPSTVSSDFAEQSDLVADIKSNYQKLIEIANLLAVGLVCLCRSYRGIIIKLRLFHNQLKTP